MSSDGFGLDHWRNPREAIANKFKDNDIAYATQGAIEAIKIVKATGLSFIEMENLSALDYGCGTGRTARILSQFFRSVTGYDPVVECVNTAKVECPGVDFNNLSYISDFDFSKKYDVAFCLNVIEHLDQDASLVLINNLSRVVDGPTMILYALHRNQKVMYPYLGDAQIAKDEWVRKNRPNVRLGMATVDFRFPLR